MLTSLPLLLGLQILDYQYLDNTCCHARRVPYFIDLHDPRENQE